MARPTGNHAQRCFASSLHARTNLNVKLGSRNKKQPHTRGWRAHKRQSPSIVSAAAFSDVSSVHTDLQGQHRSTNWRSRSSRHTRSHCVRHSLLDLGTGHAAQEAPPWVPSSIDTSGRLMTVGVMQSVGERRVHHLMLHVGTVVAPGGRRGPAVSYGRM
jgi:hypothetical protein